MNQAINTCITGLNNIGQGFWNYAAGIFIQASVLIVLLLIIDFLLRKRVRAVFRYCLWMLVFIKLVLPASFTLPTGIGYWLGDYFTSEVSMAKWILQTEEIVPTTLNIHQRSIPLEPVVTNETAYQGLIPLEPVVTNETAVIDIYQGLIPLEPVVTNETAATGIELEAICWQGLVFLGWLVGMLVLLVLIVKRVCFVRGLIAQSRPANERSLDILNEGRSQIGIRQNIELRLSGNTLSPAVCGLFKPIILIPAALLKKLSREKLKAVLIHELAHIKRGDVWVNLLQTMLQIVYFYNPFVWLANAMVRRLREQAVDEMVLVTLKPETKNYSNMLIDIAEMAFWRPNFSLRLIGVVESKKALERRIKHMLNRPVPKSSKLGYLGLIAIIVIGAILLPMGSNSIAEAANTQKNSRGNSETKTIVPGVRVGDYTFDMSKDDVLKSLGKPKEIFFGGERYTLNNLPRRYFMVFDDVSFRIDDDSVKGITVLSPFYKFTNGLGVGDSEQKIKQAFGDDFHLKEFKGADFLAYEDEGLEFEIQKKNGTVMEINVYQAKRNQSDSREAVTPSPLEPFDNVGGKDLRTCDLRIAGAILDTLEFNQETRWPTPDRLPEGFDPKALLQEGMNPGLGVRALHAEGITGAGVHVGLIDQPLLLDHPEYAGKIVSYHDAGCGPSMSSMHGPGMASQLVGSRCGTAPGAKLHVVAVPSWKGDAGYYARALDRLVMRNREVRKDQKIRVVSVSTQPSGQGSKYINQSLWDQAVQRAQANGILVLDCTWHHGFVSLCWLDPQDRESVEACTPGFRNGIMEVDKGHIHVPSAPRTTAEASDERPYGYAYDGGGRRSSRPMAKNGYSDTIPYTAGILAMGWQIRPDLTPAQMKEMLFASAYVHESGARIINPKPFIDLVQKQSDNQQTRTRPQTDSEILTIVPGLRVGAYTLDMSKDEVLRKLGEPKRIFLGEESYTLNNLPRRYFMIFDDISFSIDDDSVEGIGVHSPLYKFTNGLGVGDSEQKIKQAFGDDFQLKEGQGKDFLTYEDKGLQFEIRKKDRTVMEIGIYQPEGNRGDRDAPDQEEHSKHTIVPGLRVGAYTLDMSKDDVLKELGEPESIQLGEDEVVRRGEEKYSPDNLPNECILSFGDISFWIDDDSVEAISVRSPLYKLSNGLKVGDSEQKIKQVFGEDFHLEEALGRTFLCKHAKGLGFEIHKKNQTVAEIVVYQPEGDRDAPEQQEHSKNTIVPGLRVGDYTLGMSKDEVLRKLGEPDSIRFGGQRYTLNDLPDNLPRRYIMSFSDFSFAIDDDTITGITVRSPLYKFTNGLGVGDSEQEIKRAFGNNFQLEEYGWKNLLNYEDKGIQFEINNKDKTVIEIDVYQAERNQQSDRRSSQDLSTLVRQAAADGRISFKLTTPDEFKAIAGRPTREWTDDDLVCMKYPGIEVKFFGKPEIIPHTLVFVSCEGRGIDIGQDRPIVLRNEGDLDNFGSFWGYSSVDLSRLDLSKKGKLLKAMTFDSRTVWPEPNLLPPDFDPKAVMEWGKYPGLRVKQLHDRGVTGKGVHVAIIDQPLLLGHIEYKDQLVSYKEIQTGNADPQMHGPPVASILVGKTCGVAPGAILHYWAEPSWKGDYKYRCIALEQIIRYNREKTKSEQIRIVSVSKGFSLSEPNLDRWKTLLEKARQSGIYVVHCSSMGFGAGCRFLKDSDNPANYRLCAFYQRGPVYHESGTFFTPIDHRTTASEKARDAYTFWTRGGLSWGAPYYAGVVALGIQVNPNLRPDQIDKLLYDSGWDFQKGRLINPIGFVEAAQKQSTKQINADNTDKASPKEGSGCPVPAVQVEAVTKVFSEFQSAIKSEDYEQAWKLMSEFFKDSASDGSFEKFKKEMVDEGAVLVTATIHPESAINIEGHVGLLVTSPSHEQGMYFLFNQEDGQWKLHDARPAQSVDTSKE